MDIIWDREKNKWLKLNRGISFEEITDIILKDEIIDILKNPNKVNQKYFVLNMNSYTWVVPFLINDNKQIVLKTAFPSRKFHKIYGDKNGKN